MPEKNNLDTIKIADQFWQIQGLAEIASFAANENNEAQVDRTMIRLALDAIANLAGRFAADHSNAS